jgi:hypothetical protein
VIEQAGALLSESEGEDADMMVVKSEVEDVPPSRRMARKRSSSSKR